MKRIGFLWSALTFLLTLSILLIAEPTTAATTITVNTATDTIANDGNCSLREAIIAANSDNAFNGCPAGSGTDTIEFAPSLPNPTTFLLTTTGKNEDSAMSGDLDITEDLTISGLGANSTIIDGNNTDRVFEIHSGIHLTLSDVTVQHGNPGTGINGGGLLVWGRLTMNNSIAAANQGSGISNDGGFVTLSNIQVDSNSGSYGVRNENVATLTFDGGAITNNGGGFYNAASTATLNNLNINQNSSGSGVYSVGNTSLTRITIDHAHIMTNTTTANGGGVYNSGNQAIATITNSRISGNQANAVGGGAGGGVFNNGIMTLNESAIDNNEARTGGGIEHSGANLYLTNDTISNNQAADDGGGLYNRGSAILTNVTMNANSASTGSNIFNDETSMAIGNSIVANGTCFNSNGFLNSQGHNVDSGNSCGFNNSGDITNTNPQLGLLQDNGGPTVTHALNPGSPAIDQGDNGMCPATDQRGVSRPQGSQCDIGAYEAGSTADLTLTVSTAPLLIGTTQTMTYTIAVRNQGALAATSLVMTDTLPVSVTNVNATADSGGMCVNGSVVTCTLPTLAVGADWTITIAVTTPANTGNIVNEAMISSATDESNYDNNTAVTTTTVSTIHKQYLPLVLRP
ncbi:MAG: DUF11 domain-containing protein [Anaerolineales bacterium]|nr:DUF11 domain-containing protein [Anaerolineales bacterium]